MVMWLACVDTGLRYADWDGDGYGDPWSDAPADEAPAGFVGNADDCDDTRADVHPGADETCDRWDEDCDGEVDEGCGDAVDTDTDGTDPLLPSWTGRIQGAEEDERLGELLVPIDLGMDADLLFVDGDGYLARFDNAPAGTVYAADADAYTEVDWSSAVSVGDVGGNPDPDLAGWVYDRYRYELVSILAPAGEAFATTTSTIRQAGDFDGDGQDDVLLGDAGEVSLFLGPVAGTLAPEDGWRSWTDGCDDFAWRLLGVDLDGDGLRDLLTVSESCIEPGTVLLYRFDGDNVGNTQTTAEADARFTRAVLPDESLNFAGLSGLGDLDGDGREEAALALPLAGGAEGLAGEVFRVGDVTGEGDLGDLDTRWSGLSQWDFTGTAVAAGDFDADGARDVVIGAPGYPDGTEQGAFFVDLGPVVPGAWSVTDLERSWSGEAWGDRAGTGFAVGDFYGTDHDDLAVGASGQPNGEQAGAVYLFTGAFFGR